MPEVRRLDVARPGLDGECPRGLLFGSAAAVKLAIYLVKLISPLLRL